MKFLLTVLILLVLSQTLIAQKKRILISPYGDVIPLQEGESAAAAAAVKARTVTDVNACSNQGVFGFNPAQYPPNQGNYGLHKDVLGSWFTSPAAGVIDTIFWYGSNDVCAAESILYVRVHESNVYDGHGPGFDGYPAASTSTCWGYYNNTSDLDNGLSPFPDDEGTDPTWISTVDGSKPSYPPFGAELWGLSGVPVKTRPNTINYVTTDLLPTQPTLNIGDHHMITFRINGEHGEVCNGPGNLYTSFAAYGEIPDTLTHNWKFYEHTPDWIPGYRCLGWVARGDFHLLIWYSMTVSTNLPPNILAVSPLEHTLSTDVRVISADVEDCDPANPDSAGVQSVIVEYSVDGVAQTPVTMVNVGGSLYEGEIPGYPSGSEVQYLVRAIDNKGLENFTATSTYNIIKTVTSLASLDTTVGCTPQSIAGTGTPISSSDFFLPPGATSTNPADDGTAGPFDIGDNFLLGNAWYRYAWVSVNGAIGLSQNATDTVDVSANGFYTANWTFPNTIRHGRSDTVNTSGMPATFISPFWNDMIIADSANQWGNIYWQSDSCTFTVQWDSLGYFTTTSVSPDQIIIRAVLNTCNNTIEFHYEDVGLTGLDTTALVGIQADSTDLSDAGWIFVNKNGAPVELMPRNNFCIKFNHVSALTINDKWNLLSLPTMPLSGNYSATALFPSATSSAFSYSGGYSPQPTLTTGAGYWMKFNTSQIVTIPGTPNSTLTIPVTEGWNLIGSLAGPIETSAITSTPGDIISGSNFFGFNNGYTVSTTLSHAKGFWIKASANGTITLSQDLSLTKLHTDPIDYSSMNSITISDASGGTQTLYFENASSIKLPMSKFELPPAPPVGLFDARFTSQRYLETYPAELEGEKRYEYPISINSAAYPVTISWNSHSSDNIKLSLNDGFNGKYVNPAQLNGSGKIVIKNANVTKLVVTLSRGTTMPKEFALSQNFPNPFNPSTRFTVEVPQASDVDISVFDVLGRKIATLLNGGRQSGSYTIEWNGTDDKGISVPTGAYIVRMVAGEFSTARKILLMK